MNEIQTELLEIYEEFKRVCDKLNIPFWGACGTMLGAVRHQGFIPWDDDMDLFMLRKDYERFLKEAQPLFKSNYFVQENRTDKEWLLPFAKVRKTDSNLAENAMLNLNIQNGSWIDIFPLDESPKSKFSCNIKDIVTRVTIKLINIDIRKDKIKNRQRFIKRNQRRLSIVNHFQTKNNNKNKSEYYCYPWAFYPTKKYRYKKYIFDPKDIEYVKFETTVMPVPKKYDDYLTIEYGDWRTPPKVEDRVSNHETTHLD